VLAIPLLMFGFGFSQQQKPATTATSPTATPSVSPLPTPSVASQQDATTQQPETAAKPPLEPLAMTTAVPVAALSSDPATLPIAHIQSPGIAANFRAAPSLQSPVLGVLMHGDLVALSPDRRVQQDGVVWVDALTEEMQRDIRVREQKLQQTQQAKAAIAEKATEFKLEARLYRERTAMLATAQSQETQSLQQSLTTLQNLGKSPADA
jgi:hypothetical protein